MGRVAFGACGAADAAEARRLRRRARLPRGRPLRRERQRRPFPLRRRARRHARRAARPRFAAGDRGARAVRERFAVRGHAVLALRHARAGRARACGLLPACAASATPSSAPNTSAIWSDEARVAARRRARDAGRTDAPARRAAGHGDAGDRRRHARARVCVALAARGSVARDPEHEGGGAARGRRARRSVAERPAREHAELRRHRDGRGERRGLEPLARPRSRRRPEPARRGRRRRCGPHAPLRARACISRGRPCAASSSPRARGSRPTATSARCSPCVSSTAGTVPRGRARSPSFASTRRIGAGSTSSGCARTPCSRRASERRRSRSARTASRASSSSRRRARARWS